MRVFIASCLILTTFLSTAQDLENNVPALATTVFVINSKSINEKCQTAGIENYSFYKDLQDKMDEYLKGARVEEQLIPMLVSNGKEFGLSEVDKSYAFIRNRDSINYSAYIARVVNEESVNSLVKALILNEDEVEHGTGEGFEFAFTNYRAVAWNKNMITFLDYQVPYYNLWGEEMEVAEELNEEYYESYEERYEAEEKKKKEKKMNNILVALEEIFNPNPNHTMSGNEHFQEATSAEFDACVFVDGAASMKSNMSSMSMLLGPGGNLDEMLSIFSDNYSYFHLNINEKDIQAKTYYHMGDRWKDLMSKSNKAKFNKDILKYVQGDNLIGYFGVALDPEPSYEMIMEIYSGIMKSIPNYGETAAAGLDIFSILLDEDEIFDLIQGDAFFAITDIKEFDVSYTTYEYDENFTEQEVTKTKKELLPEYVFVASVGNEKLRNKILKIYEGSEMLIPQDGYYKYSTPFSRYSYMRNKEEEATTYVAIEGDVLIVTNNLDVVTKYLKNGVPKDKQLSKERLTHLKKNNYAGYWNAASTFSKFDAEVTKSFGDDFFETLQWAGKTFNEATLDGMKLEGDCFTATMKLDLVDQEKMAISQILEFVENVYQVSK